MSKRLNISVLLLVQFVFASAQLYFKNPSMEGLPCWGFCYPDEWSKCKTFGVVVNTDSVMYWQPDGIYTYPSIAAEGKTFFMIENEYQSNGFLQLGDASQYFECTFEQGLTYYFNFYSASFRGFSEVCQCSYDTFGHVSVYLGRDSCDKGQLIHYSDLLDTFWTLQHVSFTPEVDYNWISIWAERPYDSVPMLVDIAIDAFSPIYLVNAHAVSVDVQDTALEAGGCVQLTATPGISTADTVYWLRQVGVQVDTFGYGQWSVQVCPTATTTYMVAMRDSVVGCAGVEWSYDTARVQMPVGISPLSTGEGSGVRVYPNPAKDYFTIEAEQSGTFQLYNPIGQLVLIKAIKKESYFTFDVSGLGSGIYYYKFIFNAENETYGKIIKQ